MTKWHERALKTFPLALALVFSCMVAAGCANGAAGAAATVQGQVITEDEVTAYIDSFRNGTQRADDESWAEYLGEAGITARELRTTTIQELAVPLIVKAKADELGITADESAVSAQVGALRSSLLVEDDEAWREELERYGMTEDRLRENAERKSLEEQVYEILASDREPTDEEIEAYVAENLAGTLTKKIVSVYGRNYDNVQAALDTVSAAASVEEAMDALESDSEAAGVDCASVGWDIDAELTSGMRNVVSHLDKGGIADAPYSEGGVYYLFYIEDAYAFPADASQADLSDEDLRRTVAELARGSLATEVGSEWLRRQIEETVVVYAMPSGLSYDVEPRASDDAVAVLESQEDDASTPVGDGIGGDDE